MAAVTSGLAGGSVSAAKLDVVKTIVTNPSATIVCLRLMLRFPFLRLDSCTPSIFPGLQSLVEPGIKRNIRPRHHVKAFDPQSTRKCSGLIARGDELVLPPAERRTCS